MIARDEYLNILKRFNLRKRDKMREVSTDEITNKSYNRNKKMW